VSVEGDTIAALATAAGPGAIAVVRLSGPAAHDILRALSAPGREAPPARVATLMELREPLGGESLDRAIVVRYEAQASFTGEPAVEISCHGGWLVPALVLDACLAAGARRAEPGEFTRRAYLNGKLDLVQAEAVADLVGARSQALHRAALAQLERGLSGRVVELRTELVRVEALLAHHLDFPEEDDAPTPLGGVSEAASGIVDRLDRMIATAPEGELLRHGAEVVLAGRPNVGKSSLYNALLGEERAIVTEVPGTTRDALQAEVQLGGYPFRLVDTAGLRDTDDRVEQLGVEVARRHLERADVVLLCVESGGEVGEAERSFLQEVSGVPVVLVYTKRDLDSRDDPPPEAATSEAAATVRLSVVSSEGLDTLRSLLPRLVYSGLVELTPDVPVLTRRRHARALVAAREAVDAFRRALGEGVPPEMAGTHLRSAETALEELLGVISVEDVLDAVFGEFCIGK